MMTNVEQMVGIIERAIGGRCYLEYPQDKVVGKPFAVLSWNSQSYMKDRHGQDIASLLTYTVRVHADSQYGLLDLIHAIDGAISSYRARIIGSSPSYSDPQFGPYRIVTFDLIMDRRNQTFSTV